MDAVLILTVHVDYLTVVCFRVVGSVGGAGFAQPWPVTVAFIAEK